MAIKDEILRRLEYSGGAALSGAALAKALCVSRNAVFKAVNALRSDGYDIVSSRGGYSLSEKNAAISGCGIEKHTTRGRFDITVFKEVTSTNTVAKEMAEAGAAEWSVVAARKQSAGRGRLGRTFSSPDGTGIYFSVILRPDMPISKMTKLTVAAAVAARRAIEKNSGRRALIKWVNDVYIDGKKVCGILTEATFDAELGSVRYAVVGVGINVSEPEGGFDDEIKDIAGAMCGSASADICERTAADFLEEFYGICESGVESCVDEYRTNQFLDGKEIYVLRGGEKTVARAVCVDENCRLLVRYGDGTEEALDSGDVSTRVK